MHPLFVCVLPSILPSDGVTIGWVVDETYVDPN